MRKLWKSLLRISQLPIDVENRFLSVLRNESLLKPPLEPLRFLPQAMTITESLQTFEALSKRSESAGEVQLTQTDRAQAQRTSFAFFEMIGTVHEAAVEDAMLQTKHVAHFMHHNTTGALQQLSPLFAAFWGQLGDLEGGGEGGEIASERVNTDPR